MALAVATLASACASGHAPPVEPGGASSGWHEAWASRGLDPAVQVPAASTPASEEPEPSNELRLGPGDRIEVVVFGAETFSGTFSVDPSGELTIPLLGRVPASGHTARELEAGLATRLQDRYMRDPHVTIRVVEMRGHGVSVIGAVGRPGVYQVAGELSLLEVLALAAGLADGAGGQVFIVRGGAGATATPDSASARLIEVDLDDLLRSESGGPAVRAGDIVQVQPAGVVYVVGEVNRPGGYTIGPGGPMTVLHALAMAEGLGRTAAPGRSTIVRSLEGGGRTEVPVDLDAVLAGSEPPPTLQPRDVLFVPNDGAKSVALGVVNALVRMVTFRGLVN